MLVSNKLIEPLEWHSVNFQEYEALNFRMRQTRQAKEQCKAEV